MKQRIQHFMYGRNGSDQLSRFMMWTALAGIILSLLLRPLGDGTFAAVFWLYALCAIVYSYFRIFSRNVYKRQEENGRYLQKRWKLVRKIENQKIRFQQRKSYKFFTCKTCKSVMRVPRGKGTIRVTCKHCGETFVKKT
ncbi:MAG: hypothetical protein ACOX7K_07680 [Oscillospiraceae bacterium]|jgi:hypothetical protein